MIFPYKPSINGAFPHTYAHMVFEDAMSPMKTPNSGPSSTVIRRRGGIGIVGLGEDRLKIGSYRDYDSVGIITICK